MALKYSQMLENPEFRRVFETTELQHAVKYKCKIKTADPIPAKRFLSPWLR